MVFKNLVMPLEKLKQLGLKQKFRNHSFFQNLTQPNIDNHSDVCACVCITCILV